MNYRQRIGLATLLLSLSLIAVSRGAADELPPTTMVQPQGTTAHREVFEEVWQTVYKNFYDPTFHGLDWTAVGDKHRPLATAAGSDAERSAVINHMMS